MRIPTFLEFDLDMNFGLAGMDFFREKYTNPILLVVSDDMAWCWYTWTLSG